MMLLCQMQLPLPLLLLLLLLCYAQGLLVPSEFVRTCSDESTVFCNRDFKIADLQGPSSSPWAFARGSTARNTPPLTQKCNSAPSLPPEGTCFIKNDAVVRILPFDETNTNVGRDSADCFSLLRIKVIQPQQPRSESDCVSGTILYVSTYWATGLPGYYNVTIRPGESPDKWKVKAQNVCPACSLDSRCSDGYHGVGCCYGSTPCTCPPGKTGRQCDQTCNTGIVQCNLQRDCQASGKTYDSRGMLVPWGSGRPCLCAPGYFEDGCTLTCSPACLASQGQCVRNVPAQGQAPAPPYCLCTSEWGGTSCQQPLSACRTGQQASETLCANHGVCVDAV